MEGAHILQRFQERHGIRIKAWHLRRIESQLWNRKAQFCHEVGSCELWEIEVRHKRVRIVYDRDNRRLVTVLPGGNRDSITENSWRTKSRRKDLGW